MNNGLKMKRDTYSFSELLAISSKPRELNKLSVIILLSSHLCQHAMFQLEH
jgi:hypothetical protein